MGYLFYRDDKMFFFFKLIVFKILCWKICKIFFFLIKYNILNMYWEYLFGVFVEGGGSLGVEL